MTTRPLVIQTENLDAAAAAWLGERCEVVVCSSDDTARFGELLRRADGLLIRTYTNVNEAMLAGAPKLKVVARAGVGLDNVDVAACRKRGVTVVSTPGANTRAVVELVTAYMLDALRPRVYLKKALGKDEWAKTRKEQIAPRQLCDLTLGIIGLGRVGSGMARVGAAMDMRVMYHDLVEIPAERRFGATPAPFLEVCSQADVLTVHVDGRAENKHLIGDVLGTCKDDLIFINTSRGFVVDARKLADFLNLRPRATACVDVHEPEPFGPEYPLLGLANCRLTAHIGAATATAHANMSWVVKDLWRVLSGEAPEHPALA
jgi:phosphoglycerate dehydrogenase-like enzyme